MHRNFLFDLDQTLLDFHASERMALEIVVTKNGLKFTAEVYDHFKAKNKSLWLELEKGTINRTELFTIRFNDLFDFCADAGRAGICQETQRRDPGRTHIHSFQRRDHQCAGQDGFDRSR